MCSKDSDERRLKELEKKELDFKAKGKVFSTDDMKELQALRISVKGKTKRNDKQKSQPRRMH
jgi:hypothetical protein